MAGGVPLRGCDVKEPLFVSLSCVKENSSGVIQLLSIVKEYEKDVSIWAFDSQEAIPIFFPIHAVKDHSSVCFFLI